MDTLTDESQLAPADTLADSQLAPAAPPKSQQGTDNRDLVTGNSRPRLNGSLEGGLDGQGDDDDLKTYQPDPGDVLAALGVDASEAEFIITRLEAGGVGDPAAYLLGISAKGDGEVRDFLDWIRTRP